MDTLLDQNQAPAAHLCLLIPCSYISITPEVPPFSPGAVPVTARLSARVAWWPVWLQVCATDAAVEAVPTGMGSSAFTGGLSGWAETWLQHKSSGLTSGADAQGSTFWSFCCLSSPGAVRRAGRGLQVKSSFSFARAAHGNQHLPLSSCSAPWSWPFTTTHKLTGCFQPPKII